MSPYITSAASRLEMKRMPTKKLEALEEKPFMNVVNTSRLTGLPQCYLRKEIKAGNIPHIRSGKNILINVPALLRKYGAIEDWPYRAPRRCSVFLFIHQHRTERSFLKISSLWFFAHLLWLYQMTSGRVLPWYLLRGMIARMCGKNTPKRCNRGCQQ